MLTTLGAILLQKRLYACTPKIKAFHKPIQLQIDVKKYDEIIKIMINCNYIFPF